MAKRSEGIVYAIINGTRQHWEDKQIFSAYMMDRYAMYNQKKTNSQAWQL